MSATDFNKGIAKLNRNDEKYKKIKEDAHKCIKLVTERRNEDYRRVCKLIEEIKKVIN
jgi:hypothetical protein